MRCPWCGDDPLYIRYHDEEWGRPLYDDQQLFEFLILETFQAGLSWRTILYKRDAFRKAFDGFDAVKMARYSDKKVASLLNNADIIRNQRKILASIANAKAYLALTKIQPFHQWLWAHMENKPLQNQWRDISQIPAVTVEAEGLSKKLKQAGFQFIGPTTVYAFMQATGMVNDHLLECDWR